VGAILLFSKHYEFETLRNVTGVALIIAAVLGFFATFSRKRKRVAFLYHEMHAMTMLVYGISVLIFSSTLETLIYLTSLLFLFYACSEIIFCIWLFNLGRTMNYKIVVSRLILGLLVGFGAVVTLNFVSLNSLEQIEVVGFLFTVVGVNIMLYVPIMRTKELNEVAEQSYTLLNL